MRFKLSIIFSILLMLSFSFSIFAFQQAPELDELVNEGELPSVEKRLPDDPEVVEPVEEIGDYGGTWDVFIDGEHRTSNINEWSHTGLLRWGRDQEEPSPDLAKDYEVSEDGKVFTFYLREGLKWSDGEPFNAEDIMFWYEDIIKNDDLTPSKPNYLMKDGELAEVEMIDEYTVQFTFSDTAGLFIPNVTKAHSADLFAPKHYLKQFHPEYVDKDELEELTEKEGFDTWYELFQYKHSAWDAHNPDVPVMTPWVTTTEPPAEEFVFKRNPYFYKVDPEGNQLPYLDKIRMIAIDPEVMIMRTVAGKADFQPSRLITFDNFTLLKENEEKGDYEVLEWDDLQMSETTLQFNLNTSDEVLNEIFNMKKFKQAVSLALNRERMSEMLFNGVAEPVQASLSPVSEYYNEEYVKSYIEYKPEKANEMLNEIDIISEKNKDGIRLRPDGKELSIVINLPSPRIGMVDILELVKEDLEEVGISITIKPIHPSLFHLRATTDQGEAFAWPFAKSFTDTDMVPRFLSDCRWAPLYGLWKDQGEVTQEVEEEVEGETMTEEVRGVEPPEEIKRIQDVWDEIERTAEPKERAELYDEILKSQAENLWNIGTVGMLPKPMAKKHYFRNVPEKSTWSYHHGHFIGQTETYQYFIEKEAQ